MLAVACLLFIVLFAVWMTIPASDDPDNNSHASRRMRYEEARQRRIEQNRRRALEAMEQRQEGGVQ